MSRPLRIEFPGAFYHVTSRGDRREAIYEDDEDRVAFLGIFRDVVEAFRWRCHAYCLMTNHYHLFVETFEGNLAKGMRQLNGVYTQRSNRHHRLSGHLFQGRYKGILVDSDAYLLALSRYIVLNPVAPRSAHFSALTSRRWGGSCETREANLRLLALRAYQARPDTKQ